ncbi:MAG: tetratricopeptide repeat protein [Flavipsychrobacter sp.]|nr:tetratricopeptide repeat protein [Flavipsychrobacter sp.]
MSAKQNNKIRKNNSIFQAIPQHYNTRNETHVKLPREQYTSLKVVLICTFIIYIPSLFNQFVNWDDPAFFLENPAIVNATSNNVLQSIVALFSTTVTGGYTPLVTVSFLFEKLLWGFDNSFFWHLDNLLLHLLCTWLVYKICGRLKFSATVCFITALLFGIHPMHVESVVWITERKDLLYTAFSFIAIIWYMRYHEDVSQKRPIYWAYTFFTLALLSKIQAVTLPFILLLIDYLKNDTLNRKMVLNKISFFLLSILIGTLGILFLKQNSVLVANNVLSFPQHLVVAAYLVVVYLLKSIVPYRMVPIYPYPTMIEWYMYASLLVVPILIYITYRAWKRNNRVVVFGLLFFICNVFFVLQIITAGQGYMSDRYSYLSYIGLFLIYATYFEKALKYFPGRERKIKIAGGLYVLILILFSILQMLVWQNSEVLWRYVLKYYKNQSTAFYNLAMYYHKDGKQAEAIEYLDKAIKIEPQNAELYQNRADIYFEMSGDDKNVLQKALADCNKAISLNNHTARYYANRANVYGKMGNLDSALLDVNKCILLDSNNARAYYTRYMIHMQQAHYDDAINDVAKYLEVDPDNVEMQNQFRRMKMYPGR